MRAFLYIVFLLLLACDQPDAWDCIQTQGALESKEYPVGTFDGIRIEDDIDLFVRQASQTSVRVEAGVNMLPEIEAFLEGTTLVIRNNNNCNLVRNYSKPRAYVTFEILVLLRNSSIGAIRSQGLLELERLQLVSNSTEGVEDPRKSGDFYLDVQLDSLLVQANGSSVFNISGRAERAVLSFEDEWPSFEGADLEIGNLRVLHRSAKNMVVNPLNSIEGVLRSTGDVIARNRPEIIAVEEFYTGRLIFQD